MDHLTRSVHAWAKNRIFKRSNTMDPKRQAILIAWAKTGRSPQTRKPIPAQLLTLMRRAAQTSSNHKIASETLRELVFAPAPKPKPKPIPKPVPKVVVKPKPKPQPKPVVVQKPVVTRPKPQPKPQPKPAPKAPPKKPVTERTNDHNHGLRLERIGKSKVEADRIRKDLENKATSAHQTIMDLAKRHNYKFKVDATNEFMAAVNVDKLVRLYVQGHNTQNNRNALLKLVMQNGQKADPAALARVERHIATTIERAESRFQQQRISVRRRPGRRRFGR